MDSGSSLMRQMPVSIEAEQALLGSIIVNPDSFDKIGGMISADDFYVEEHKHIYSALLKKVLSYCERIIFKFPCPQKREHGIFLLTG